MDDGFPVLRLAGLRAARMVLARAVQIVLRNVLTLLGIGAPRRMERPEQVDNG